MSAATVLAALSNGIVAKAPIAPRVFFGQMCGIRLPGAPPVDGGAADSSLILSWFYSRYPTEFRPSIIDGYRKYPDVLTSWTDDRAVGISPAEHVSRLQELCAAGLRPAEMLGSKLYCPNNDAAGTMAIFNEVLPLLIEADCVSRYCIGFELDLWNSYASLQALIDAVAEQVVPKRPLYVHFSPGYADWRPDFPGSTFADFWNPQVGKLTGLWHQAVPEWTDQEYQDRLGDVLARFAGGFNVSPDSGFGHPFDCVALEITAMTQFNGTCTEAQGDARARVALSTPPAFGPLGAVPVIGSGNGS